MPDPEYVSHFSNFSEKSKNSLTRESPFQNYFNTRCLLWASEFVSLVLPYTAYQTLTFPCTPLSFDVSIEQGPLYVRDMFKACKLKTCSTS